MPVTVPVYWVGQPDGRSVLYREYRAATAGADTLAQRIDAAVGLLRRGGADAVTTRAVAETAGVVQAAVGEIARLQARQGYVYLKP